MKVLIAGNPTRGKQWEKYLRKNSSVSEVIITSEVQGEKVDAIVLLDDSPANLTNLLMLIRQGYPVYLVSHLSTDTDMLQKIYHASEEANISVQFSHWSSFTSMTRWVRKHLNSAPRFIDIRKHELGRSVPDQNRFRQAWIDELAFILSLQRSSVQQVSVQPIQLQAHRIGLHITIRFENSTLAALHYMAIASEDYHKRFIQAENSLFICDSSTNKATYYSSAGDNNQLMNAEHRSFQSTFTAEISLDYFIRSIKTYKPSGFTSSTALQTARLAQEIDDQLRRA